ncbi:MAG: threonylcarbamoyl-AMP synthase, partial [Candidatus Obscuribacterales bacterium]|nr:threonylcarbamoyl-AMP synthase [Candidatus Obscuribacterales bacterium]
MIQPLDRSLIESGARALRQGLLVAFPTETVYGLGADAESLIALKRLYEVKGRPDNHPVIVHIHCLDQLDDYAEHVQAGARALADRFWPGPLTLILPKSNRVPMQVTGGQNTVGLRIPNHPVALALLKAFGGGVAAPSANRFGRISPTTAKDVSTEFGSDLVFVLEGGVCQVGIESTIVDFSGDVPRLLRPGMILPQDIRDVVGRLAVGPSSVSRSQTRAPGGLSSHYAPRTPLELVGSD